MILRLWGMVSPARAAALIALVLITNAFELVGFSLFIPIIDLFQAKGGALNGITRSMSALLVRMGLPAELPTFLLLLCILFLAKGGLTLWMRYVSVRLAADAQDRLRLRLFRSLLQANVGFVQQQKQGALLSVLGEHVVRAGTLLFLMVQMVAQWVAVLVYLAFVLWISWKLTLVALVLGGLLAPAIRWMGLKAHYHGKKYAHLHEESQHLALEGLQAKKLVNAMNWARTLELRYREASEAVREHWQRVAYWSNGSGVVIQPLSVVILSLIIWLSLRFDLSVALLGTFALAFTRLLPSVQSAVSTGSDIQASKPSIERVFELLDQVQAAREPGGNQPFDGLRQSIRLEGVHFQYPSHDPIFSGLDLEIRKGATIALVGRSGAGKTTIADLIVGLYQPTAGRIVIDGVDLTQLDMHQYRQHISYVSQEAVLFHDTIRHNLTMGLERSVADDELRAVCERAGAWDFISGRQDGLNAIIGDRGVQLSGGQRQRLALARALLRRPDILILDEATSALDQESEHWVARTLSELQASGDLTILVIAHRYTTIQHADLIVEIRKDGARILGDWEAAKSYLLREAPALTIS